MIKSTQFLCEFKTKLNHLKSGLTNVEIKKKRVYLYIITILQQRYPDTLLFPRLPCGEGFCAWSWLNEILIMALQGGANGFASVDHFFQWKELNNPFLL